MNQVQSAITTKTKIKNKNKKIKSNDDGKRCDRAITITIKQTNKIKQRQLNWTTISFCWLCVLINHFFLFNLIIITIIYWKTIYTFRAWHHQTYTWNSKNFFFCLKKPWKGQNDKHNNNNNKKQKRRKWKEERWTNLFMLRIFFVCRKNRKLISTWMDGWMDG